MKSIAIVYLTVDELYKTSFYRIFHTAVFPTEGILLHMNDVNDDDDDGWDDDDVDDDDHEQFRSLIKILNNITEQQ